MNRSILFSIAAIATIACAPEGAIDDASADISADASADDKGIEKGKRIQRAPALSIGSYRAGQEDKIEEGPAGGPAGGPADGLRPDEIDKYCDDVPVEPKGCPEFAESAMEAIPALAALDKACGVWADRSPVVYMADMKVTIGNADWSDTAELKAIVCDGHVADVREVRSGDARKIGEFPGVEQVFYDIGRRLIKGAQLVEIEYDADFGYPAVVTTLEEVKGQPGIVSMKYEVRAND